MITLGTSKGQLIPIRFAQDAVADAQSAVAMNTLEVAATVLTVTEVGIPFKFSIVGISVSSDSARTAGTLTADATINGSVTGIQAQLNASDTQHAHKKVRRDLKVGVSGDRVGVKLTTASWTPVTADIVVTVWVLAQLEGI